MAEEKRIQKARIQNALARSPKEWVQKADESYAISMAELNAALLQKCEADELAMIHDFVMTVKQSAEAFIKSSKKQLMVHVLENGQKITQKGTMGLDLGNGYAQYIKPKSTKKDADMVERLLRAKTLDPAHYMDTEPKYYVNEVKLALAVEKGLLTEKELEACVPELTYVVGKSKKLGPEGLKEMDDE